MTFDIKEFLRLRDIVQKKQRDLDRAQGEWDSVMSQMTKAYGCKTVEEALKLAAQLGKERKQYEEEYDKKLAAFTEEFGGKLRWIGG